MTANMVDRLTLFHRQGPLFVDPVHDRDAGASSLALAFEKRPLTIRPPQLYSFASSLGDFQ